MDCNEIGAILNDHEIRSLSVARRAAADAHLGACRTCADAWLVAEALARESLAPARRDLLADVLDSLGGTPGMEARPKGRHPSITHVGLLAASVVLAGGVAVVLDVDAPPPSENSAYTAQVPLVEEEVPTRRVILPMAAFEAGRDYEVLRTAQPTAGLPGTVQVSAFFMYGCRPCYAFQSYLERWSATRPDYIRLVNIPVIFNAEARLHALAFYAAEELGKLDEMHSAFFREIHVNGNRLDSESALAEFFERFGVEEPVFRATFASSAVLKKVERAEELTRRGITATPVLVVGGRYLASPAIAGSFEAMFEVVDALAESLRAEETAPNRCNAEQPRSACRSAGAGRIF